MKIRDRIRELRRVPANELQRNAQNWRMHPPSQTKALQTMLQKIGFAGALLARETDEGTLELIDGHLRADLTEDAEVPVLVLDVSEAEAEQILATHDAIGEMAEIDSAQFHALKKRLGTAQPEVQKLFREISQQMNQQKSRTSTTKRKGKQPIEIPESYELVVTCVNEEEQREVYDRLAAEGYDCRVLTL